MCFNSFDAYQYYFENNEEHYHIDGTKNTKLKTIQNILHTKLTIDIYVHEDSDKENSLRTHVIIKYLLLLPFFLLLFQELQIF